LRRELGPEGIIAKDLPTHRVDHDEERQDGFHGIQMQSMVNTGTWGKGGIGGVVGFLGGQVV
jgi:hypothetical protein